MVLPEKMLSALTKNELQLLRSFVPLYTLSTECFDELVRDVPVEDGARGTTLFSCGDTDQANIYLLDGVLGLFDGDKLIEQIDAGSSTARFPIAHIFPRKYSAKVQVAARLVRLDSRKLSDALASEHTQDYQVSDLDNAAADDWMTQLLQSRVLQQVPASNIQRVMMCVEQVQVQAGESIIRQGDIGDYYYMLSSGQAVVSRDMDDGQPPVELARLSPGSAFGEEALLSDAPRNSTITMLTPGHLLRLSKADFVELIHHPLTIHHDYETARDLVEQGAVWLDVRRSELFEADHLPSSLNLPFDSLRYQTSCLAPDRHYVIIADSGTMMAAAAFLLTEQGYDVAVLEGGYDAVKPQLKLVVPNVLDESDKSSREADRVPQHTDAEALAPLADMRVRELEARIVELEEERDTANTERQQSLEHLSEAIDQARARLLEVDKERERIALERDRLVEESSIFSTRFEESELEREGLRQQLADVQQRDEVWQTRLRKAEGRGIAERDRAESASQRYEDQVRQIEQLREEREVERDAHAQSLGLLKEQITELQLDLEMTQGDLKVANTELQSVRSQRESDAAQGQTLLSVKTGVEEELVAAHARIQELDYELGQLRHAAGDEDATRPQLLEKLNAAVAKAQPAEQQDELRSQLECSVAQLASLQDEYDQLSTESDDLRAEQTKALRKAREQADALQDELVLVVAERDNLQQKLATTGQHDSVGKEDNELIALATDIQSVQRERDAALNDAAELRSEVESLRDVMATYVDQIRAAQSSVDNAGALNAELQMVRDQATQDVARLRNELSRLQAQLRERDKISAGAPLAEEAMRQDLSSLRESLAERQRELATADLARRRIEDQLEDAAGEIERLRRQGDTNTSPSPQLSQPTVRPQRTVPATDPADDIDDLLDHGLRDRRVKTPRHALDMDQVTGESRMRSVVLGSIVALLVVVGGLEATTFLTGRGELFTFLFGG